MSRKGMGEAQGFSLDVINEIRRAINESGLKDYEVFKAAGISKDYFYTRMRGEKPFNTNDISKIADALGMDAFLIMRRAAQANEDQQLAERALRNIQELAAKKGDTDAEQEAYEEEP